MTEKQPALVDLQRSPAVNLHQLPISSLCLKGGFWASWLERIQQVTLPTQYRFLEETGRLENFRRAAGSSTFPGGSFQGYCFNDSDVYKWLEGAAWGLALVDPAPTKELAGQVQQVVRWIAAAQGSDGYLDTYYTGSRAGQRWSNLRDMHEMYCAGHLIQAGVALRRSTGNRTLLRVATRFADHIDRVFGPGKRAGICGHPEIEVALVELYRQTRRRTYLELAQHFIAQRGHGLLGGRAYYLDRVPLRELGRLEGHAVRAMYLCAAAADVYAETEDLVLRQALERLWQEMAATQTYISGGLGSRHEGEAFGAAYELPNGRAYAESCAAIGGIMWVSRMLAWRDHLQAERARYADALEWTLYNAVLPGIGLDGQSYFYENLLADTGGYDDAGWHRRQPWFDCACCPTNLVRFLAAVPAYFYSTSAEGLWVHLYGQGEAVANLPGRPEQTVKVCQETRYPWDGRIRLEVQPAEGLVEPFSLFLRLPGWLLPGEARLCLNGHQWESDLTPGTYVEMRRVWQPGDVIELELGMPPYWLESHPYALENTGRVALGRGPLLYCLEAVDQGDWSAYPGARLQDVAVNAAVLPAVRNEPGLLGGVTVLRMPGKVEPPHASWQGLLCRRASLEHVGPGISTPIELTAVPYYAWANRAPAAAPHHWAMQVWLKKEL